MRILGPVGFALSLTLALTLAGRTAAQDEVQTPAMAVRDADGAGDEALAQPAESEDLSEYLWTARPIVVFADSPADPRFRQQIEMLEANRADLEERDVVVLTDTEPATRGPLRQELRPRDFNLVLIDKDGTIAARRPSPTPARELIRLIDRMPSRRQEIGSPRQ
jgi:Domain of unknown function (DUF4174)